MLDGYYSLTRADIDGTSFVGVIRCSYQNLLDHFGDPLPPSKDGKTRFEWAVSDVAGDPTSRGDRVFSVYDYKRTDDRFVSSAAFDWHVGGRSPLALALVAQALGVSCDVVSFGYPD